MKNLLRWALCQLLGKTKGAALCDALLDGPLGVQLKAVEDKAIGDALGAATAALKDFTGGPK